MTDGPLVGADIELTGRVDRRALGAALADTLDRFGIGRDEDERLEGPEPELRSEGRLLALELPEGALRGSSVRVAFVESLAYRYAQLVGRASAPPAGSGHARWSASLERLDVDREQPSTSTVAEAWFAGPPLDEYRQRVGSQAAARRQLVVTPIAADSGTGCELWPALLAAASVVLSRYYGQRQVAFTVLDAMGPVSTPSGGDDVVVVGDVDPAITCMGLVEGLMAAAADAAQQRISPHRARRSVAGGSVLSPPVFALGRQAPAVWSHGLFTGSTLFRLGGLAPDHAVVVALGWRQGAPVLYAEWDSARTNQQAVDRLTTHIGVVLRALLALPDVPVATLPMLTPEERQRIIVDWNSTRAQYPSQPFHGLVERQADRAPDAVAVVDGAGDRLTYRELDERANQLAHHLRGRGVRPGDLVGVALERSVQAVVAVLGVLKCGGAYVPLDPLMYPKERIEAMLADSSAAVVVSQSALLGTLPEGPTIVCLDDGAAGLADEPTSRPESFVGLDGLAYVMYTSGSTGVPKGVLVPHRGLANLAAALSVLDVGPDSRVLQFAPFSFDISVGDMILALTSGATLCMASVDALLSPEALLDQVRSQRITNIQVSPSILATLPVEELPELRTVLVGAEPCPADLVARWAPGRRFLNVYGPTETTICATYTECASGDEAPPIGRPIPNARIYLLDEGQEPVAVGVPGEIYIGGVGVAAGYLNRPELTAERFLFDPFAGEVGARMYRTGDLGRYLPDGVLEFLGRVDDQVKVLGHRIELGEVESVLSTHPGVKECAVAAVGENTARRLVAYVVAFDAAPSTTELRAHLKRRLPEYMVPAAFVTLDALPLTPNGKVDRAALPAPGASRPDLDHDFVGPANETEATLAEIWGDVLGLEAVGVTDDFFELGGDSILAIQAMATANRVGLRLHARQLSEAPTIRELAHAVGTAPEIVAEQGVVVGQVPLTPIQRWFFEQGSPNPHHYTFSALLHLPFELPGDVLSRAIGELVHHHDALRLRFERRRGEWRQECAGLGLSDAAVVDVDLRSARPEERETAVSRVCADLQRQLRIDRGPLIAVAALRMSPPEADRLFVAAHHLVIDGVSWRILLEDLATTVQALRDGRAVELPMKTSSFRHWAERLAELAVSRDLAKHAAPWVPRRAASRLPMDGRGPNVVATERHVTVSLGPDETGALLRTGPVTWRTTVNDLALAAVVGAVCEWTGSPSVRVDVETHGREDLSPDIDVSRTVGWFTALFPVDIDVDGTAAADAVRAVKAQMHERQGHTVDYGLLRYLRDDALARRLAAVAPPEIGFNYLGQFDQSLGGAAVAGGPGLLTGLSQEPAATRPHAVEVVAYVLEGRLHLDWAYSCELHHEATIRNLADGARQRLVDMAAADPEQLRAALAPADFPLANLDRRALDAVLAQVPSAG